MPSAIPSAVDGLLTLLRSTFDGSNVHVFDGVPRAKIQAGDAWVSVGGMGEPTVVSRQEPAGQGGQRRRDTFDIACYLRTSSGGDDEAAKRVEAYQLFGQVEEALRGPGVPARLGGSVTYAQITENTLTQPNPDDASRGAYALITFTVTCQVNVF